MINSIKPFIYMLFLSLVSCSSASLYETVRQGQINECRQLPDAQQEKCLQRSPEAYQKYQQQRDELKH